MDLEIINKLFLELSQVATAETKRELVLRRSCETWQRYASYCACCAKSGEHDIKSFDNFEAKTTPR